jgi:hypothetical protein
VVWIKNCRCLTLQTLFARPMTRLPLSVRMDSTGRDADLHLCGGQSAAFRAASGDRMISFLPFFFGRLYGPSESRRPNQNRRTCRSRCRSLPRLKLPRFRKHRACQENDLTDRRSPGRRAHLPSPGIAVARKRLRLRLPVMWELACTLGVAMESIFTCCSGHRYAKFYFSSATL